MTTGRSITAVLGVSGLLLLAGCPTPADPDGKGGPSDSGSTDNAPSDDDGDGYATDEGDCDDADATVHPGAIEDCATPADDDCDGETNPHVSSPPNPSPFGATRTS